MQCNIDARGKRFRLLAGIIMLLIAGGIALVALIGGGAGWWVWLIAVLLASAGGFSIFEAGSGWCAVRALGIKTPM